MLFTADSAKQFLVSKITAQAAHDGLPLEDIEKRMFLFSETSGTPDFEANNLFESKYDDKEYESKIAKLLHRAYAQDKRINEANEWKDALDALKREDFYGLVMVDAARIPRNKAGLWAFVLGMLPLVIIEGAVAALGCLIVFRPAVLGLYLPDWVRWLAFALFIWLFWYVGQVFSRIRSSKPIKPSELTDN